MKLLVARIIGLIIVIGAVGGLILAVVGLVAVQRAE